ncbi:dihydrolipoamide acetyltransferase family protein [Nocardia sp. NPDC050697]|uniref:dihydrolipoamide acetyltransferase family protein n=1 Tax=Nocardia sp. NPDC050697 TaxID=3155158 RepID=UPI0033C8900E
MNDAAVRDPATPGPVLEFRLPDLGEGLADAELVSWAVAVGDEVELNQVIAEVETAKAVVALPSPFAGVVAELLAQPGETVPVGSPLIRVRGRGEVVAPVKYSAPEPDSAPQGGVLVGYGPSGDAETRRRPRSAAEAAGAAARAVAREHAATSPGRDAAGRSPAPGGTGSAPDATGGAALGGIKGLGAIKGTTPGGNGGSPPGGNGGAALGGAGGGSAPGGRPSAVAGDIANSAAAQRSRSPLGGDPKARRAAATPAARKLAKELGIDLWFLAGSGPEGAVTVEDVRAAVPISQPRRAPGAEPAAAEPHVASDARTGVIRPVSRETRTPIAGVRRRTAAAMVVSARTIPQAGASVTVDFTAAMELLDHLRNTASFEGLPLTPLTLVAKATLVALGDFPDMNAFWDDANQQIVTKHYVNLGIAVATERGLLVPNLKEAQTLSLRELCRELSWLVETARAGNAGTADLRGGTFTITNVGVFGVDSGVPLVNPGEGGILCLGAVRKRPWVVRDELAVRWVTTLGVAFDHRMIDGDTGARFLADIAHLLEDPLTLLSRG